MHLMTIMSRILRITLAAVAVPGMLALNGCDLSGGQRLAIGANDPNEPESLIDSFRIARGMEFSFGRSGRATPQQITELIRYDRAAVIAVQSAEQQPGYDVNLKAQHALQALMDYTTANDLAPPSGQ